mmetsp:Transcript_4949/g.3560  ORF Transcript_4949/g.3560 Transcript_4949/m.3560 type:complete len:82 (+) Transcript_4949:1548-1793(+)
MGEEVCAWVRTKDGHKLTAEELVEYCHGHIAHFKIPRYFRFVKEFPLTVTNKVKKNEMRHLSNELLKQKEHDIIDVKKKKN